MKDISRNIPRIDVALEDRKVENQSTMIEIEGNTLNQHVSVLVVLGNSISYISPQVVQKCNLKVQNFRNAWLVHL